jgi:O-antigen/teichoic acid export membrane protein
MSRWQYLRHAATLLGATATAQIINLLLYPVIARTYDSTAVGYFSLFVSAASIVGPLAAGRFDVVIQASPFAQRFAVFNLAVLLSIPVALLSGLGFYFYAAGTGGFTPLRAGILFSMCVILLAYTYSGSALLLKSEAYGQNSASIIARALLTAVPQILLFFVFPTATGLVAGFVCGLIAQALVMHRAIQRQGMRRATLRQMQAVLSRYRQYPLFDVLSTFLSMLVLHGLSFFLLELYGADEVGYFGFAFRIAAVPMALIAGSLSSVFFQRAAKAHRETGSFTSLLNFNLALGSLIAGLIWIAKLIASSWVIDLYLGSAWAAVADVLILLAPMMALRFVFITVSATPLILGQTLWLLGGRVALAAGMIGTYVAAEFLQANFLQYLQLTSIVIAVIYTLLIAGIWRQSRISAARVSASSQPVTH